MGPGVRTSLLRGESRWTRGCHVPQRGPMPRRPGAGCAQLTGMRHATFHAYLPPTPSQLLRPMQHLCSCIGSKFDGATPSHLHLSMSRPPLPPLYSDQADPQQSASRYVGPVLDIPGPCHACLGRCVDPICKAARRPGPRIAEHPAKRGGRRRERITGGGRAAADATQEGATAPLGAAWGRWGSGGGARPGASIHAPRRRQPRARN